MKDYCKCEKPVIEAVTDSEQHGGYIREVIIGYECSTCGLEIDPDTLPSKADMDYELYMNE